MSHPLPITFPGPAGLRGNRFARNEEAHLTRVIVPGEISFGTHWVRREAIIVLDCNRTLTAETITVGCHDNAIPGTLLGWRGLVSFAGGTSSSIPGLVPE